jgi:hypothetical protein
MLAGVFSFVLSALRVGMVCDAAAPAPSLLAISDLRVPQTPLKIEGPPLLFCLLWCSTLKKSLHSGCFDTRFRLQLQYLLCLRILPVIR